MRPAIPRTFLSANLYKVGSVSLYAASRLLPQGDAVTARMRETREGNMKHGIIAEFQGNILVDIYNPKINDLSFKD